MLGGGRLGAMLASSVAAALWRKVWIALRGATASARCTPASPAQLAKQLHHAACLPPGSRPLPSAHALAREPSLAPRLRAGGARELAGARWLRAVGRPAPSAGTHSNRSLSPLLLSAAVDGALHKCVAAAAVLNEGTKWRMRRQDEECRRAAGQRAAEREGSMGRWDRGSGVRGKCMCVSLPS